MTFDEARAQFPVFDRIAYLNAGSAGPLPRVAVEAARAALERDLAQGRSGTAYIEEILERELASPDPQDFSKHEWDEATARIRALPPLAPEISSAELIREGRREAGREPVSGN